MHARQRIRAISVLGAAISQLNIFDIYLRKGRYFYIRHCKYKTYRILTFLLRFVRVKHLNRAEI